MALSNQHVTDHSSSLPIAVTCGDPSGIGPEVIEKAFRLDPELGRNCVVIGPMQWTQSLANRFSVNYEAVGSASFMPQAGKPSLESARLALESMALAANGCLEGKFGAVVTGPVSKSWLQKVGFAHPGQTEFFADSWAGEPTMAFVGEELRVVLATWHIPLREVADALTPACLERSVRRANDLAQKLGVERPRIGVCGLNPHAGEDGILGREEIEHLNPLLDQLRGEIPGLSPCLPGDTVFHRQRKGDFDIVVAAYHDQALAAVKTVEFDSAVNVTLGLPFIRTSPDHGTAYDLAGQGKASPSSFLAAIKLARKLAG